MAHDETVSQKPHPLLHGEQGGGREREGERENMSSPFHVK